MLATIKNRLLQYYTLIALKTGKIVLPLTVVLITLIVLMNNFGGNFGLPSISLLNKNVHGEYSLITFTKQDKEDFSKSTVEVIPYPMGNEIKSQPLGEEGTLVSFKEVDSPELCDGGERAVITFDIHGDPTMGKCETVSGKDTTGPVTQKDTNLNDEEWPLGYVMVNGEKKRLLPVPTIYLRGEEVKLGKSDLRTMAMNLYFESRNRSAKMQETIVITTLNRVGKYGEKDLYGTVTRATKHNGMLIDGQCAFSWYCDADKVKFVDGEYKTILNVADNVIEDKAYRKIVKLAMRTMEKYRLGEYENTPLGKATHYHRVDTHAWWAYKMTRLAKVDDHIFYSGH